MNGSFGEPQRSILTCREGPVRAVHDGRAGRIERLFGPQSRPLEGQIAARCLNGSYGELWRGIVAHRQGQVWADPTRRRVGGSDVISACSGMGEVARPSLRDGSRFPTLASPAAWNGFLRIAFAVCIRANLHSGSADMPRRPSLDGSRPAVLRQGSTCTIYSLSFTRSGPMPASARCAARPNSFSAGPARA